MPLRLATAVALLSLLTHVVPARAEEQGKNFVLTIDGKEVGIDVGETVEIEAANGQRTKVSLVRAKKATFRGELLSFAHPGDMQVSATDVDENIRQYLLASAKGTFIMVQEYAGIDPSSLAELILTSVTEESVAAGGRLTRSETRRDAGGRDLKGIKAEVVSGSDKSLIEVFAVGGRGKGVIIITQIADDYRDTDQAVLDTFWRSVAFKL